MEPLRVGFIGAGVFSTWAIYPALHLAPIDLRAVCDRDAAKAQDAARRFGAPRWYTDHREMWEKEDLEAVILWMKPRERQALALEALEAGYHVLVPKPPAPSLDDCLALADASTRTGKSLMVHFHRRFSLGGDQGPRDHGATVVRAGHPGVLFVLQRDRTTRCAASATTARSTRSCSTSPSTTSTWCVISAARSATPPPSMTSATAAARSRSPCGSPAARWVPCN